MGRTRRDGRSSKLSEIAAESCVGVAIRIRSPVLTLPDGITRLND